MVKVYLALVVRCWKAETGVSIDGEALESASTRMTRLVAQEHGRRQGVLGVSGTAWLDTTRQAKPAPVSA